MKTTTIFLVCALIAVSAVCAQVGNVSIPTGAEITIPIGATLCADTIFANHPGFGTLTYPNANNICRAVVIPVELLTVSAVYGNGTVALRWTTASERNCAGYEVQRETPDGGWQALGFVPGKGLANGEQAYAWVDELTPEMQRLSVLRYRLRLVDTDGSFDYSPVVEVRLTGLPASPVLYAAYPNPASRRLHIPFTVSKETEIRIAIFSITGEEITTLRVTGTVPPGSHIVTADLEHLRSGSYMIELVADGVRRTQPIVVRR